MLDLEMRVNRIRVEELRHALDRIGIRGKMVELMKRLHQIYDSGSKSEIANPRKTPEEEDYGKAIRQLESYSSSCSH